MIEWVHSGIQPLGIVLSFTLALNASVSVSKAEIDKSDDPIVPPADVQCIHILRSPTAELDTATKGAQRAVTPFNDYFSEVGKYLVERELFGHLASIALLAREHLLLMGPPGNAKTMLADTVYGGIVDERGQPSYFRVKMNNESNLSDTHGPINLRELERQGVLTRVYREGILGHRLSFIDEFFDSRPKAWRNLLDALGERSHGKYLGKTWSVIAATNKYLAEIYEKSERGGGSDEPRAVLDRFAMIAFVPSDFILATSYLKIMNSQRIKASMPKLTFQQIESLHQVGDQVTIPMYVRLFTSLLHYSIKPILESIEWSQVAEYKKKMRDGENPLPPGRAPKYLSPRTLGKAANILQALVLRDWIRQSGHRSLVATLDDVAGLEHLYSYNGPTEDEMAIFSRRSVNPYESHELQMVNSSRSLFRDQYKELLRAVNESFQRFDPVQLVAEINSLKETGQPPSKKAAILENLYLKYAALFKKIHPDSEPILMENVNGETVAAMAILESFAEWLLLSTTEEEAQKILASWDERLSP